MVAEKRKKAAKQPSVDESIHTIVCKSPSVTKLYEGYSEKRKAEIQCYLKSLFYLALSEPLPVEVKNKLKDGLFQVLKKLEETQ